ncbi:DUF1553 domain-containing protein [Tundrisphaera sp. TA3]|uniref:DUF1553 domain-containing protein n=1 Tax=Tundrisphaera sp. TA3 TaxID=3435775 RepID=UPI003EBCA083
MLHGLIAIVAAVAAGAGGDIEFDRDVRPILARSCLGCHGPGKQKGGLRLDRKASALGGGEDAAILPGRGADSPVVRLASGLEPDRIMPPTGERLTPDEVGLLRTWIDQGAEWPGGDAAGDDPRDWWSLRPLRRPAVPDMGASNPIDAFIRSGLRARGLRPSPMADRRTLIRRLSFDLIGLPPSPAEIEAFAADPAPDAYERLVDRLLASPHHGERWARHWLDVVHYGDSHGYDKDQPRPNAWPYRDYVIRSLNGDKPYGQFVAEQVAGDRLYPGTADGITALGFIAAGPWDLIGHAEVPETKLDGKVARHLDRDDMVANALNTFTSLTVQCARCHDHKFDPIRQEEYYRLQAIFAAIDRADRPYHDDPEAGRKHAALTEGRKVLERRKKAVEERIRAAGGSALAELDRRIAAANAPAQARPEFGYHGRLSPTPDATEWVQVDLGAPSRIDRVVLWGAHDDFNGIGAGFGFPPRYRIEASDDPEFRAEVSVLVDRTDADVPNPGITPQAIEAVATARYVRLTATRLALRQGDYHLAMAELEVINASGKNLAAGSPVASSNSIEAPPRWRSANLTDGYAPGRAGPKDDPVRLAAERDELIGRTAGPGASWELAELKGALAANAADLERFAPTGLVYAGTIHTGTGNFRGTGADGGRPRPIHRLRRGNVDDPGPEVAPGVPAVSAECPGEFDFPEGHPESARRAALARWLIDPKNPLTWRSIVNRVWQYHFGRALAATPNDLGRMGSPPTHPELLDWLAADFRDGGQSLKVLHRRIVTSEAYRQSSADDPASAAIDAENLLLWRMNRRKLDAESIRDATLVAAGTLDRTMYGPPFRDFAIERPEHSPHYEYRAHDPDDPASRRRSIYRFLARSRPQPFMAALDCADPSMQVDRRNETLSPLQALALYNNGLMLASARHMAKAFEAEGDPASQVAGAFMRAIGRAPTPEERDALGDHTRQHGLANACRVILNLNEFVFVD